MRNVSKYERVVKGVLTAIFCFITVHSFAQNSGRGFQYAGIALNEEGEPRVREQVSLRFSLVAGIDEATPQEYYAETQQVSTDEFGAFSVVIGQGQQEPQPGFGNGSGCGRQEPQRER